MAMLFGVLSPSWPTNKPFAEAISNWEIIVGEFENQTGEKLASSIKIGLLLKSAPEHMRHALQLQVPNVGPNYDALREFVRAVLATMAEYDAPGVAIRPTAMAAAVIPWTISVTSRR